jgi:hypothetical protein
VVRLDDSAGGDAQQRLCGGGDPDRRDRHPGNARIDAALRRDSTLRVAGRPDIALEDLSLSGPNAIPVDALLDLLVRLQSLSATRTLSAVDTALGTWPGN